ncbi:MAG: protein nirF [Proteobacteria bacterium]|nr:protein nirF [Pseudomonadota bacterium]
MRIGRLLVTLTALALCACAAQVPVLRGTGDLGVVVERETGRLKLIETSGRTELATIGGLGDLSHASVVYSRDARYAYVFGRDGGLSKVDLLEARVVGRVVQAGNSIGGAISQDGRLIAVANYDPGGVKVFDAATLELLSDIPSAGGDGTRRSKVIGIADAPGNRFVFSLFEAGEIWIADVSDPRHPQVRKFTGIGKEPYDGLITPGGRFYIAGLYGEDGVALLDLWNPEAGVRRILGGYGRGEEKMPVYKMPHLRGWAVAGNVALLPAVGRNEVLFVNTDTWAEAGRVAVHGQPVFVIVQPGARRAWVNFAFPNNDTVQVIDIPARSVIRELKPGRAVLHMEFTPRGEQAWVSSRDDNRVTVYDTATFAALATLPADHPSGIFLTSRAFATGF